jgi:hypothetical protein
VFYPCGFLHSVDFGLEFFEFVVAGFFPGFLAIALFHDVRPAGFGVTAGVGISLAV